MKLQLESADNDDNHSEISEGLTEEDYNEMINSVSDIDDNDKPFLYTLEIMDQNVKITYINETQTIVIKKDNYEISSNLSLVLESDIKEIQNITCQESLEISDININDINTSENLNADEKLKDKTELNICSKSEPKIEYNNLDYTTVCF